MIMIKIFTTVLFIAIWLQSAFVHASYLPDMENQALDSVRLNLWYKGIEVDNADDHSREVSVNEESPEELERALQKL